MARSPVTQWLTGFGVLSLIVGVLAALIEMSLGFALAGVASAILWFSMSYGLSLLEDIRDVALRQAGIEVPPGKSIPEVLGIRGASEAGEPEGSG